LPTFGALSHYQDLAARKLQACEYCELRHRIFTSSTESFYRIVGSDDEVLGMRKVFEHSLASKTVVAKLIKLGYLNDRRLLTNKTVRIALERLQLDLSRNATIQARVQRYDESLQID
jgi:hypothetical protein